METNEATVQQPNNSKEIPQNKSVEQFIDLKNAMLDEIGIPDRHSIDLQLGNTVRELENLKNINEAEKDRPTDFIGKIKDRFKDLNRYNVDPEDIARQIDDNMMYGRIHPDNVKRKKTEDLKIWKESIYQKLKKFEELKGPLAMVNNVELDPKVIKILEKYDINSVEDLFLPESDVDIV